MEKDKLTQASNFTDEQFVPRGAMLFFVLLILLGVVIWFTAYFMMLNRN